MTRRASSEVPSGLFVAVIGDLVGSRELPDRAAIQAHLRATLADLGERFSEHVASRFLITLGDEFQGLLLPTVSIDRVFWRYQCRMHAVAMTRFGFGVGRLATPLRPEAIGMDGPCFHAARTALTRTREQGRRFGFEVADEPALGEALDRCGRLLDRTLSHWTEVQWETATLLAESGNQAKVARAREVSRQSIGKIVEASYALECFAAWEGVAGIVRWIARSDRDAG